MDSRSHPATPGEIQPACAGDEPRAGDFASDFANDFERALLHLVEASGDLLSSPRSAQVLPRIIALAQQFVKADAHAVWHKDAEDNWSLLSSANLSPEYIGNGLVSAGQQQTVLEDVLWYRDVSEAPELARRLPLYQAEGIQALLAVPLKQAGESIGSVTYYWKSPHVCTESQIRIARALSSLAAGALNVVAVYEREIASRERAEHGERQAAFLAAAGVALSSSLDYTTTLANLARLAVPSFADWCSVDIVQPDGAVERVAIHHTDPEKAGWAYDLHERFPPDEQDIRLLTLRSGKSVLVPELSDSMLAHSAHSEEHLECLRRLGPRSVICAPMLLNGQVFGMINFVHSESGRSYGNDDLRTAEEVARRAAIAISHARLYQEVRTKEERLQLAASVAGLGIWENDLSTNQVKASPTALRSFGFPPGDGFRFGDLLARVHPDDVDRLRTAVTRFTAGSSFQMEYRVQIPGGPLRWMVGYGRHIWRDGRPSVIGATIDNTERRLLLAAEQDARRTAQLLNSVGPMLLSELDPQALVKRVVELGTALVGAELGLLAVCGADDAAKATLVGTSGCLAERLGAQNLAGPELARWVNAGVIRLADVSATEEVDLPPLPAGLIESSGARSLLAAPMLPRTGRALGTIIFLHREPDQFTVQHEQIAVGIAAQSAIAFENARLFDEARRVQEALRRSNEELRQANEDLNQFAYSASHDLQEPLRMVGIYTQMLEHRYRDQLDARARQYMGFTINGAKRMEMLVKDLLEFTKSTGPMTGDAPPVPAGSVLNDVLANLKTSLDEANAQVTIEPLPHLCVNRTHLLQIFQNLIGNALKYRRTDVNPRIHVAGTSKDGTATISVADNGIGISPAYAKQIFGIFKRLHSSDQYSGTGIGLAICQRLVERYGGKIWVDSSEGAGATFRFTVPLR